ncbi:hypothetical protein DB31_3889 [Hyalangium minutum]|uniref:Uncharacterized protein n=1 Tax=Hyalangium minutum TaxID=394096 RepID=A0A085W512_9BACT|nr:hypothetical protein DB31_3889 [Hyalangium minutum]
MCEHILEVRRQHGASTEIRGPSGERQATPRQFRRIGRTGR